MEFAELPEFSRELKSLKKKYKSLEGDLETQRDVLQTRPEGTGGKHWICLHQNDEFSIWKTRLACKTLKGDKMRVIYAFIFSSARIEYVEIYFKGDKPNEDRERVAAYIKETKKRLGLD
ncbi:MAG TPA: hypothetical protein VFL98_03595 [Candidatus Paceibacterota bacterium]|nr:hypothetical protein [Candidatus Paceibacterota bacterium]